MTLRTPHPSRAKRWLASLSYPASARIVPTPTRRSVPKRSLRKLLMSGIGPSVAWAQRIRWHEQSQTTSSLGNVL